MRKLRQIERAVLTLVAAATVLAGRRVFVTYWDYGVAAGELPQAVRDYRAIGLPWTAADISTRVAPKDNAAPLLWSAIAALPDEEAVSQFEKGFTAGTAGPPPDFVPSLRLAHRAARLRGLDFVRDWDLGPNLLMPEEGNVKLFCKLLVSRAEHAASRGDDGAALSDLEDARRLASLIGSEPTAISALVGEACDHIAAAGARRCLVSAGERADRLGRYRRWLASPPPLPDLVRAFRGDIYLDLVTARNLDRMGMGRGFLPTDGGVFADGPEELHGHYPPAPIMRRDGLPSNTRTQAYMARCLQMYVELARSTKGLTEDMETIGRRSQAIGDRYADAKGMSHQFDAILFPVFSQFGRSGRVAQAARAVTLAFADALLLHARTGRWPAASTTLDPLGHGPLGVRFDGKRFRVWSVGRNGKDEGGLAPQEAYAKGKRSDDEVAAYPPIPKKISATAAPPPPMYGND